MLRSKARPGGESRLRSTGRVLSEFHPLLGRIRDGVAVLEGGYSPNFVSVELAIRVGAENDMQATAAVF